MGTGAITPYIDVAQLVLYAFWIFFFALIYYLQRESHREGYPMDHDSGGVINGWPKPEPKTFRLADGSEVHAPNDKVSPQTLNARPLHRYAGAPLEPVGNPLLAGVGPGAWSDRADVAELDEHGKPKIVPLRLVADFGVASKDPDPRGMEVTGGDRELAGTVVDLWVDTSEMLFRYLEVSVARSGRRVLLPLNFARITWQGVAVHAIHAHQFADVPGTRSAEAVTILEEEKIMAYYGAGLLYADETRAEPLI
jgi:photosynthetic reaction center H subunit